MIVSRTRVVGALVVMCGLVAPGCGAGTDADSGQVPVVAQGLTVTVQSDTELAGVFVTDDSVIRFLGRAESPTLASMRFDINGLVIDGTVDNAAKELRWDGHDGVFSPKDLAAMKELMNACEKHFVGRQIADLAAHEQVVMRRLAYYAAAPAGWPLGREHVRKANFVSTDPAAVPAQAPEEPGGVLKEDDRACYQSGDPWSSIYGLDCRTMYRYSWHDAVNHCYTWAYRHSGPGNTWCVGKCGDGCGWFTFGYTQDCLDHDVCAGDHGAGANPWDSSCGDEWGEADEDYMWSYNTCYR